MAQKWSVDSDSANYGNGRLPDATLSPSKARVNALSKNALLHKIEAAVAGPPVSEWITSVSERAALNDGIFIFGGKIDVSTNELPPRRQMT